MNLFWGMWLVATGCTVLWFHGLGIGRYERVSENLMPEQGRWMGVPENGVELGARQHLTAAKAPAAVAYVLQPITLRRGRCYEVSSTLQLEAVVPSAPGGASQSSRWGARLLMIPCNAEGRPLYDEAHVVATRSGTALWEPTRGMITMPADVDSAFVGVDLHADAGELWAHSFEVFAVAETVPARWGYWLLVSLWLAVCCRGFRLLFPEFRVDRSHAVAVCVLGGMLAGMLVPKAIPQAVLRAVRTGSFFRPEAGPRPAKILAPAPSVETAPLAMARVVPAPAPVRDLPGTKITHKLAHLLLFWMFTVALSWTGVRSLWRLVFIGGLLGVGTEMAQMFAPTRSSAWFDVGVDVLGVGLGVATIVGWRCLRSAFRRRSRADFGAVGG